MVQPQIRLIGTIADTVTLPTIQWGGSETNGSGTGIRGTDSTIVMSIAGADQLTLSSSAGIAMAPTAGNIVMTSTVGALIIPKMTTTQRDALTGVKGMIIYNTSTDALNVYDGAWKAVTVS